MNFIITVNLLIITHYYYYLLFILTHTWFEVTKELLNIAYHLFDLNLFSLIIEKIREEISILTFLF